MTRPVHRREFLGGLLASAACAACGTPGAEAPASQPDQTGHPLAGMTNFDGEDLPLPELLGTVTVLDFWASWCEPCRHGFRYLDQLYRTYVGDGLRVLGVGVDADPADARRFHAQLRPKFPVAWDPSGAIRDRFRVQSLPTTLLLDKDARLIHRQQGFDVGSHRVLETHVRRLVRGM